MGQKTFEFAIQFMEMISKFHYSKEIKKLSIFLEFVGYLNETGKYTQSLFVFQNRSAKLTNKVGFEWNQSKGFAENRFSMPTNKGGKMTQ